MRCLFCAASPISPPFAWLLSYCMDVSVGGVQAHCRLTIVYPHFLLSFSGALSTLDDILPSIISTDPFSSPKTVGRNKGTAILFSLLYYHLRCKSCVCVCACVRVLSYRLCYYWLIIHYVCSLDIAYAHLCVWEREWKSGDLMLSSTRVPTFTVAWRMSDWAERWVEMERNMVSVLQTKWFRLIITV